MPSNFVMCRDADHAAACCDAGLLWVNVGIREWPIWQVSQSTPEQVRFRYINNCVWKPEDFAVLVEE